MPTYHTYLPSILITKRHCHLWWALPTPKRLWTLGELTAKQCQQQRETPEAWLKTVELPLSKQDARTCQASVTAHWTLHGADHPAAGHSRASLRSQKSSRQALLNTLTKGTWHLRSGPVGEKHAQCARQKPQQSKRGTARVRDGRRDGRTVRRQRAPCAEAQGRRRQGPRGQRILFNGGGDKTEDPGQGCSL